MKGRVLNNLKDSRISLQEFFNEDSFNEELKKYKLVISNSKFSFLIVCTNCDLAPKIIKKETKKIIKNTCVIDYNKNKFDYLERIKLESINNHAIILENIRSCLAS